VAEIRRRGGTAELLQADFSSLRAVRELSEWSTGRPQISQITQIFQPLILAQNLVSFAAAKTFLARRCGKIKLSA